MNALSGLRLKMFVALLGLSLWPGFAAASTRCDYRVAMPTANPPLLEVAMDCGTRIEELRFPDRSSRDYATPRRDHRGITGYRFELGRFAADVRDYRRAARYGDAVLAVLGSWLALPVIEGSLRLSIEGVGGSDVLHALAREGAGHALDAVDLRRAGYSVFGAAGRTLSVDGFGGVRSRITVADLRDDGADIVPWIADTASQVASYYGGFPVDRLLIAVVDGEGAGIEYGRVIAGGGATMLLVIGREARLEDLYGEWVLVHEMLHLGMPFLPDGFWFMEGLATYAEPIIRARAGWRSERSVWNEFARDMPRGLAAMTGDGLARDRRGMYWGGALFMLLADIGYRRSGGAAGLEHCLRSVRRNLGGVTRVLTVREVIAHCDTALQAEVMGGLYRAHVAAGSPLDLDATWARLGVARQGDAVVLDEQAAESMLRRAIVRESASGTVEMDAAAPDAVR
jgi:hypothetical protein